MKLGSQTASLTNHILSRSVVGQPEPFVGMGATILCWTDRLPATVVAVDLRDGVIAVREDHAARTDKNGMSECQTYEYSPNPNGSLSYFRKDNRGVWGEVVRNEKTGRWNKSAGHGLRIGERAKYHDFSF